MLSFQGNPLNITKPLLGKVTWNGKNIFSRHRYFYIAKDLVEKANFYQGMISGQSLGSGDSIGMPCLSGVKSEDLNSLEEDDIVFIEPNGNLTVLWDASSSHNAIFATEACNCACIMCPQPKRQHEDSRVGFNLRLLNLINPEQTCCIGITGGEPTLLGDDLSKLIRACKNRLPRASLLLLSNGKRFSDINFVRKVVEVDHPDITICIPLYSDTDKEHDKIVGINGSFYETIKGIDNLALFRQKIEIRNVILSLNYKRLPQFAEFIYHNFPFAIHVAMMGMEVTGVARHNLDRLWIDPIEYMGQLKQAIKYLNRRDMNASVYNLQLCILPDDLWGFSRKSISTWKNVYLDECKQCHYEAECGGFFGTSEGWNSKFIHSLKKS